MSSFKHRVKGESKAYRFSYVKTDRINHDSDMSDDPLLKKSWDDEHNKCYAVQTLQTGISNVSRYFDPMLNFPNKSTFPYDGTPDQRMGEDWRRR